MPRLLRCILLFLLLPAIAAAQPDSLREIKGFPAKQIYDLLVDSRGFLWIGHEQGLSRFDGTSFTHFSCPQQNSLGLGDLLEDPQGRIWCRNFTSQVFYVEKEKMNLLTSYDSRNEAYFPSIMITGNTLVANSAKGLFVCNTATMKSAYIDCKGTRTTSMSLIRGKILAQGDNKWFLFDPATGAPATQLDFHYQPEEGENFFLQNYGIGDTAFCVSRYKGIVTRFVIKGNELVIAGRTKFNGLLYTINPSGTDTWIHASDQSINLRGTRRIRGYELTDLVTDKEGNTWYSSIKNGLLVSYKSRWDKIRLPGIGEEETVRYVERGGKVNIYGTNSGKVILQNNSTGAISFSLTLPAPNGPILYIGSIDSSRYILATGVQIYLLNMDSRSLFKISYNLSLKNAMVVDSSVYLATATGLYELLKKEINEQQAPKNPRVVDPERSRRVEYNKNTNQVLVAFKEGLAEIRGNRVIPVLYKGAPIPAITMQPYGRRFFISTFSNGMMTLDESGIKKMEFLDKYLPGSVKSIKIINDTAWLLGNSFIIRFDPKTEKIFGDMIIPSFPDAEIYDLTWINGETVLLTGKGAYALRSSQPGDGLSLKNYLLKIVVNGRDTVLKDNPDLPYNYNSVDFHLAVPFYTNSENIYYNYRLAGSSNPGWKQSESGTHEFRFSSLSPGQYTFEALAVHPQFGTAAAPIIVPFTIRPAWDQTTGFRIARIILITGIIALFIILFFRARIRRQKTEFEKRLIIQNERQRISAEIHDDIGAGLSGVRLLTELTRRKIQDAAAKEDLDKIYASVTELSGKVKDVVWSLNTGNDTLAQLLHYLQQQAHEMLQNSNIHLNSTHPEELPDLQLGGEKRTDLYLLVKEALHNALKHSGATTVGLHFRILEGKLIITIRDDGKGLHPAYRNGNGMLNMKKRIERLNGTMALHNNDGLTLEFFIPLN